MTLKMEASMNETPTKASEEIVFCSPCSENGSMKNAQIFCVECGIYFCGRCLQDHNKFPALRSHQIVDRSRAGSQFERGSTEADEPTESCFFHRGHILDRYCPDHDTVCCTACVTFKHRSCTNVDHIKNAAKGITSSLAFKYAKESLEKVIKRIQVEQNERRVNVASLDEKKKQILNDIDRYQDDIIDRIKEIAVASRQEVESKHAELVNAVQSDAKELGTVLKVSQDMSKKVNTDGLNEAETFTNIIQSKKVVKDIDNTLNELSMNWCPKDIEYSIGNEGVKAVLALQTFGHFSVENRPYIATSSRIINVKMKSDSSRCYITGICILDDNTYVASDFTNRKLKRLDKHFELTDCISLDGSPISVCKTGSQEVAVALREEKTVQFVICDKPLSLGASFNTELRCMGLYFDSNCGELYVSCGEKWRGDKQSKVNVYQRDGTLLRSYENDEAGSQLFSSPNNIVMATTTGVVYVADFQNGLIAFTKSGKKLWAFTDPKLKGAWGVCLLPRNQLLVTGYHSGNILQIGADGKEVCELIGTSEGLNPPYVVTFDKTISSLMVCCNAEEIRVFQLSRD